MRMQSQNTYDYSFRLETARWQKLLVSELEV